MKVLFIIPLVLSFSIKIYCQKDLSGAYGYTMPFEKTQPPKDKTSIPGGQLVLIRMEDNKYRFWLDVLTGPPGYNRGESDGNIIIVNDTASFESTFENAEHPCILKFKITGSTININSQSTSFNCGFGNGVNADGDYLRLKQQPVLNNAWLKKEYHESTMAMPSGNKAELFQDENCFVPFSPKKYFMKADSFLSIAETDKSIYTEYIPAAGKFIWGWLKKTGIKIIPPR